MWTKIKENWHLLAIALVVVLLLLFRLTSYGDPRLSIGTNDSSSYFDQVRVPTFSWEALKVRRLPAYVLLFKVFEPEGGYQLEAVSYPAAPEVGTSRKQLQPGFDHVVVFQMWLSIVSWVFFALMIARHLKNKPMKVLSVAIILTFGFLPPIAEWDSIIMSESGSYSLFMAILGISIEIIKRVLEEGRKISRGTGIWCTAWFIVFLLWAFMRDSNANILIITAMFILVLMLIPRIRKHLPLRVFVVTGAVLLVFFLLYASAASLSGRWLGSWDGLYNGYITPYPDHYQFFLDHGMPETNPREWATENGAKTYLLMLLHFPRFTMNMFIFQLQDVFSENLQPFFFTGSTTGYRTMVALSNIFHPLSSVAFLLSLLSGILVATISFRLQKIEKPVWGWMSVWILLLVFGYFGVAFYGDCTGLIRHLQGASMPMRLLVWVFPIVLADFSLGKSGT
ncbi:MAG: hypothetical protein AB9891_20735 [Anaerolineaceae bacterium]